MYTPLAGSLARFRNFFGILRVVEASGDLPGESVLELRHGRIVHGVQNLAPERRLEPTAYYGPGAGIGLAIQHHPRRPTGLRLGVLGLGTGTLAAFGEKRDVIRFYEINPDVIRISGLDKPIFTFAAAGRAKSEFVLGDGRLMLERELAREGSRRFDILALDAFSSDSIPMHLLTREAMRTYLGHLAPGGILAIHISNRYLDLAPVVRGIAREFGLAHVLISAEQEDDHWATTWALLAREPAVLKAPAIANAADPEEAGGDAFVWSDDYSNLLRVLKL
jgi:SAM-dependent methyltransferase